MKKRRLSLIELEDAFDTQSIKLNGDSIWPVLRLRLNEELRAKDGITSRTFKLDFSNITKLVKTIFYGIGVLFTLKSYKYWVFSSSDRRKRIGSIYVDRVAGSLVGHLPKTLTIENPYPKGGHFRKKLINDSNIISQTVFYVGVQITKLFVAKKVTIENEPVLLELIEASGFSLDYNAILRNHVAQYRFMRLILKRAGPKAIFLVYSASSMGFIKAFKEKSVPVIELQHGVINNAHQAYSISKDYNRLFFPDYLFTYGKHELSFFGEGNYFIDAHKVFPVGYSFLDEFSKIPPKLDKTEIQKGYEKIVVFSIQEPFENIVFPFLVRVAALDQSILFLMVPRNVDRDYAHIELQKNMVIEREMNIYECLQIADIHFTVNSTCAIEALYFGVPNILYDYDNWARSYYENILNDKKHTKYVITPEEFIFVLNENNFYSKKSIIEKSAVFFTRNFIKNADNILEKEILIERNEQ